MKVLLYSGFQKVVSKSGVGEASGTKQPYWTGKTFHIPKKSVTISM